MEEQFTELARNPDMYFISALHLQIVKYVQVFLDQLNYATSLLPVRYLCAPCRCLTLSANVRGLAASFVYPQGCL